MTMPVSLRRLKALHDAGTPGPWLSGMAQARYGAVASRSPRAMQEILDRNPEHGQADLDAYGGALVAESISKADRDLIVAMHTWFPLLIELTWFFAGAAMLLGTVAAAAVLLMVLS